MFHSDACGFQVIQGNPPSVGASGGLQNEVGSRQDLGRDGGAGRVRTEAEQRVPATFGARGPRSHWDSTSLLGLYQGSSISFSISSAKILKSLQGRIGCDQCLSAPCGGSRNLGAASLLEPRASWLLEGLGARSVPVTEFVGIPMSQEFLRITKNS